MTKKSTISSAVDSGDRIKPGSDAPIVTEIKLNKTAIEMIFGTDSTLNQLLAIIEGEFKMKIFPKAVKAEPKRHH